MKGFLVFLLPVVFISYIQNTLFFILLLQTSLSQVSNLEYLHFASLSKYNKNLNIFLKCSLFLHSKLNTVMCFGIELTLWFSSNFR